ncbi:MAG: alanine racemase [Armatimonadota bacterium]
MRPAWVEVDLSAIRENIRAVNACVGHDTGVLAVVKADAYGHGLAPVARAVLEGGATMLGVAIPEEVSALREAGITAPALILGCTLPHQADQIVAMGASAVVSYPEAAQALAVAACKQNTRVRVHVKVNTGMGRVGVRWHEAADFIRSVAQLPNLELEGVMTHFATADEEDLSPAREQLDRFLGVVQELESHGIRPRYRHASNSAAITFLPGAHLDLVRPGLLTYGIPPAPLAADYPAEARTGVSDRPLPVALRPALSLKARIVQVHHLPAGDAVGYGLTYRAKRDSIFALLPLGYADGVSRALSNRGHVILRGRRAPIAGRVSMDQTIVDVTGIPGVAVGDTAVLIGEQDGERITAWEVGLAMGSIAYEALTGLSVRLPRVYLP